MSGEALRCWINEKIRDGEVRREAGEHVEWLADHESASPKEFSELAEAYADDRFRRGEPKAPVPFFKSSRFPSEVFGRILREERRKRSLSMFDLAELVRAAGYEIDRQRIGRLERGGERHLLFDEVVAICLVLRIDLAGLCLRLELLNLLESRVGENG